MVMFSSRVVNEGMCGRFSYSSVVLFSDVLF